MNGLYDLFKHRMPSHAPEEARDRTSGVLEPHMFPQSVFSLDFILQGSSWSLRMECVTG